MIILFIMFIWFYPGYGSRQCYVCHSGDPEDMYQLDKSFPGTSSFPPCSAFRKGDSQKFLKKCPDNQLGGCLTKFDGSSIMRTCSRVSVDDCKQANGVTYCYCKSEACNTPDRKLSNPKE